MKMWSRRLLLGVAQVGVLCLLGITFGQQRAVAQNRAPLAEEVFKNVRALKGMSVADFLGTMGLMVTALQSDCAGCHVGAGTDKVDWASDAIRQKVVARTMVNMVANINRTNFGGRQLVTCWTCHRNRDKPVTTPAMSVIYSEPSLEPDEVITQLPGLPSAESILDRYIQASGGAQRLAAVTSYVAKGTSVGFGGFGGGAAVEIYAKVPDKRATIVLFKEETGRGDQIRSYDGNTGWVRTPLNILGEYQLNGGELDGARIDAQLGFPGQIKQILTNLRSAPPSTITDLPAPTSQTTLTGAAASQDHDVDIVQGNGPRGLLVTLYFDKQTGLLLRELRYADSPIGRIPTQIDFFDYRDVNGIKLPFRMTFAWVDGRDAISLDEIRTNVAIDDAKFGRPAPLKKAP